MINYNPLRLHAQSYTIDLLSPTAPNQSLTFSIRPLRLRSDRRGNAEWNPWWRTALLIQTDAILPIPSPDETQPTQTTGYLWAALYKGLTQGMEYLGSVGGLTEPFAHALPTLHAAPDGPYILSHNRKT